MHALAIAAALVAAAAGCNGAPVPSADPEDAPPDAALAVPYRLAAPDAAFELPAALDEISGLTVLPNGHLAAVQDEDGEVFEIDPATGAVLAADRFANDNDYEGLEVADGTLWVLESDGDLYEIVPGEADTDKIETGLKARNDTEGLAYDAAGGRLLIACKEHPGVDGDVRAIWAFDLATRELGDAPVVELDRAVIDEGGPPHFKPSALAVHPRTGELYVVSSVRKAILVLTPAGEIAAAVALPEALYGQPEGIAFAPDGTLFLSNESTLGPATLLRYAEQGG